MNRIHGSRGGVGQDGEGDRGVHGGATAESGLGELGLRLRDVCERLPGAGALHRAVDDLSGPLRVAVTGRFGTGRDTLARALRQSFDVSPIGPGDTVDDADAWLYVLAGWPRPDDVAAIGDLDPRRSLVVLGKADSLGSWPAANERAAECAHVLGRPVVALMPLLAVPDLRQDDVDFLAALAAAGRSVPPMQAEFVDAGGAHERLQRLALLRRLDAYGVACALALIGRRSLAAGELTADELTTQLQQRSGIDSLSGALTGFAAIADEHRVRRVVDELEIIAAQGILRDEIEHLLSGSVLSVAAS
jgi:hypothetical protein